MNKELDAVIAALRGLADDLRYGNVVASGSDPIANILTNGGEHEGLTADEIDQLAEDLNCGDIVLSRKV